MKFISNGNVLWSSEESGVAILSTFFDPGEEPVDYHKDALSYWNSKRGKRFAPRWEEISLVDFGIGVVPMISVTDIKSEPLDSKIRFWGTKLTQFYGGDYTGCSPADVPPKIASRPEPPMIVSRPLSPRIESPPPSPLI